MLLSQSAQTLLFKRFRSSTKTFRAFNFAIEWLLCGIMKSGHGPRSYTWNTVVCYPLQLLLSTHMSNRQSSFMVHCHNVVIETTSNWYKSSYLRKQLVICIIFTWPWFIWTNHGLPWIMWYVPWNFPLILSGFMVHTYTYMPCICVHMYNTPTCIHVYIHTYSWFSHKYLCT